MVITERAGLSSPIPTGPKVMCLLLFPDAAKRVMALSSLERDEVAQHFSGCVTQPRPNLGAFGIRRRITNGIRDRAESGWMDGWLQKSGWRENKARMVKLKNLSRKGPQGMAVAQISQQVPQN